MLKLMIVGRRRAGMTVAQLHRYMVDVHGAMVLRHIATSPKLTPQRYVQNHVFDGSYRLLDGPSDPFASSRDFVTQVWFDDPAQAAAATQAPLYLDELQPDEDKFVDQASVVKLPVMAQPLFEACRLAGSSKLFVFHRRAPGVPAEALAAATQALWQPLLADAARPIDRVLRNTVLSRPGAPAPAADLVDEAWLGDDGAARALGEHWQALAEQPALSALLAPRATVVLLAREMVLHAGA